MENFTARLCPCISTHLLLPSRATSNHMLPWGLLLLGSLPASLSCPPLLSIMLHSSALFLYPSLCLCCMRCGALWLRLLNWGLSPIRVHTMLSNFIPPRQNRIQKKMEYKKPNSGSAPCHQPAPSDERSAFSQRLWEATSTCNRNPSDSSCSLCLVCVCVCLSSFLLDLCSAAGASRATYPCP